MFDTVFVTSKQDFRGFDREEDRKDQHPENAPCSTSHRATRCAPEYVTEVEPEVRVMGQIVYDGQTHFGFVTGPAHVGARERGIR